LITSSAVCGARPAERHIAHRQTQAARHARVDQALHRAGDARGFIAHTLQVADGLADGDQQAQVAGGGLAARDDGRQVGVDVHLHLVDALFADQHLAGDFAVEVRECVDGLSHLGFDQAAHFQHAGRDAAQLQVELAGQMFFSHGFFSVRDVRCARLNRNDR